MKIVKIIIGVIKWMLKCYVLKVFVLKKCFVVKKERFLFKIYFINKIENKLFKGIKNEEVMKFSYLNMFLWVKFKNLVYCLFIERMIKMFKIYIIIFIYSDVWRREKLKWLMR